MNWTRLSIVDKLLDCVQVANAVNASESAASAEAKLAFSVPLDTCCYDEEGFAWRALCLRACGRHRATRATKMNSRPVITARERPWEQSLAGRSQWRHQPFERNRGFDMGQEEWAFDTFRPPPFPLAAHTHTEPTQRDTQGFRARFVDRKG